MIEEGKGESDEGMKVRIVSTCPMALESQILYKVPGAPRSTSVDFGSDVVSPPPKKTKQKVIFFLFQKEHVPANRQINMTKLTLWTQMLDITG